MTPRFDALGRPTHCLHCGKKLKKHPHAGRPRVCCNDRCYALYRAPLLKVARAAAKVTQAAKRVAQCF